MPNYGDIVYTLQRAWVATLAIDGTYGTPAYIEYPQDAGYEPQHDTDVIKAQGADREGLSVMTGLTISINEASGRDAAIDIITGETATQSGASGNRQRKRIISGGGGGLPYIGLILEFAGTNGSGYVFGVVKAKADAKPKFEASQNEFRKGEFAFKGFAYSSVVNKMVKVIKYETSGDIDDFSQQANFQSYLQELQS